MCILIKGLCLVKIFKFLAAVILGVIVLLVSSLLALLLESTMIENYPWTSRLFFTPLYDFNLFSLISFIIHCVTCLPSVLVIFLICHSSEHLELAVIITVIVVLSGLNLWSCVVNGDSIMSSIFSMLGSATGYFVCFLSCRELLES